MKRKLMCLLLATAMVISLMPMTALAQENAYIETGYCGAADAEGNPGENLQYVYNMDAGTVAIHGTGDMYNYNFGGLSHGAPWFGAKSATIDEGVTSIGDCAFIHSSEMKSLTIPSTVRRIGNAAFEYDYALDNINLPDGLKEIDEFAFHDCTSLKSAVIPKGVRNLKVSAFAECSSLETITLPEGLETIEGLALADCSSLKELRIPASVNSIMDGNVVCGCSSMTRILVAGGNPDYYSVDGVLYSRNSDGDMGRPMLVAVPGAKEECIIPDGVVKIDYSAFEKCGKLKHLVIPGSVESLRSTFYGCGRLTGMGPIGSGKSIEFGWDTSIPEIRGCEKLEMVIVPEGMKNIGEYPLCTSLKRMYIPSTANVLNGIIEPLSEVYYGSSREDWERLYGHDSECFQNAVIHFNSKRTADGYYIVKMEEFGVPVVNGSGDATVYYRVEDEYFNPAEEVSMDYDVRIKIAGKITSQQNGTVKSDGNGIIGIPVCNISSNSDNKVDVDIILSLADHSRLPVNGNIQSTEIKTKKASYKNTWTQKQGNEVTAGEGISILKSQDTGFSITDSYENGKRTLSIQYNESYGEGAKASVDDNDNVKGFDIKSWGGGLLKGTLTNNLMNGVTIPDYDPSNPEHLRKIGQTAVYGTIDRTLANFKLAGTGSLYLKSLRSQLWDFRKADNNLYSETQTAYVEGRLDAFKLGFSKLADANGNTGTLLAGGGNAAWSWSDTVDEVKNTRTVGKSVAASLMDGGGFETGGGKSGFRLKSYILGEKPSYNNAVNVAFTADTNDVKSASFVNYTADTLSFLGHDITAKDYDTTTFAGRNAAELLEKNEDLHSLAYQENAFVNLLDISAAMGNSGLTASISRTHEDTSSLPVKWPTKLFGGILTMTPSLSFSRSIKYEAGTGVLYNGEPYETVAISEEAGKQILEEARNANLVTIMTEPIEAALSSLSNKLKNASGQAKTGLRLGDSLLKGTGGGLYTVISTLADSGIDNSSGQVIPASSRLMADADDNEEYNEDEDAVPVGCLTIGEPYMVGFFTDEECTEAATEQEVDSAGVTLTLNYTDEMLAAAGAEADPVIRMYRFDAEKNLYVLVPDSRQDVEKKTVKAPVSKAGEYILAIDAEGPVIDNFVQTDASLKPAFSVFVGDAGGLADFRCWLDDEENGYLITEKNLNDYYDKETGLLTYSFRDELEDGYHAVRFQAEDEHGNRLAEPVSFDLEAHGITGTVRMPETASDEIVTKDPVPVMVKCSQDNSFSQVMLLMKAGGNEYPGIEMTQQEDGSWSAEITPVAGCEQIQLMAVGLDDWGNYVTSEVKSLSVNIPDDQDDGDDGDDDDPLPSNPFSDVSDKAYYFDPVLWAVNHKPQITNGTSPSSFSPDNTCTRAQVVTFLYRAAGEPEVKNKTNPFTDVKPGDYYYNAVLWAVENGITKGLNETTFGSNESCTRAQVVTFLYRTAGEPEGGYWTTKFSDVDLNAYYGKAVMWAVMNGITKGTTNTTFSPDDTCTRGQIVTFLYRAYTLLQ